MSGSFLLRLLLARNVNCAEVKASGTTTNLKKYFTSPRYFNALFDKPNSYAHKQAVSVVFSV